MSHPLISVVIPTRNRASYLVEAVQSVFSQDYPSIELIVVDDGSTDSTRESMEEFSDRLLYHYQSNGGIASARNTGVGLATGELISFLDDDDLFTLGRLTLQMDILEQIPTLECVQGHMEQFISPELPSEFKDRIRGQTSGTMPAPMASTMLIKRAAYDRVGPWDENCGISVDLDWYARMMETDVEHRMLDHVLLRRRIHTSNTNLVLADQKSERLYALKRMLDRRRAVQKTKENS